MFEGHSYKCCSTGHELLAPTQHESVRTDLVGDRQQMFGRQSSSQLDRAHVDAVAVAPDKLADPGIGFVLRLIGHKGKVALFKHMEQDDFGAGGAERLDRLPQGRGGDDVAL